MFFIDYFFPGKYWARHYLKIMSLFDLWLNFNRLYQNTITTTILKTIMSDSQGDKIDTHER